MRCRGSSASTCSDKLGEEFDALVTGVVDFGLFVQVKGVQVDGLVHVSALGADYFSRDSSGFRMVGARSGRVFRLGDQLRVRLINVIIDERKIDFELAETRRRARDPRAVAAAQGAGDERDGASSSGCTPCARCCSSGPERASLLVLQKGRDDARIAELRSSRRPRACAIEWRDAHELDRLAGDERHQGACLQIRARGPLGEGALDELLDRATAPPLLLVLDGVQDPHNLGACLRTADAAGATAVIVPRDRAAGLTPAVRKVASGAAETMPLIQVDEPGAHAALAEGARDLDRRHRRPGAASRCSRRS